MRYGITLPQRISFSKNVIVHEHDPAPLASFPLAQEYGNFFLDEKNNPRINIDVFRDSPYLRKSEPLFEACVRILKNKNNVTSFETVELFTEMLKEPEFKNRIDVVRAVIQSKTFSSGISDLYYKNVFSQPQWVNHTDIVLDFLKRDRQFNSFVHRVLSNPIWAGHPEVVQTILEQNDVQGNYAVSTHVLTVPEWQKCKEWPNWVRLVGEDKRLDKLISIEMLLPSAQAAAHPELVFPFVLEGKSDKLLDQHVFSQPAWKESPEVLKLTQGKPPTARNIRSAIQPGIRSFIKNTCSRFFESLGR